VKRIKAVNDRLIVELDDKDDWKPKPSGILALAPLTQLTSGVVISSDNAKYPEGTEVIFNSHKAQDINWLDNICKVIKAEDIDAIRYEEQE
jgi:co-chaperonin GroES (HSP10)